jgi:FkbM family methyltransferase
MLKKTKLNGLNFWYQKNDKVVGGRIALGKYEEYETKLILKQVKPTDVVVDVGANIGYYTVLLAQKAKIVYAIEPEEETFEILSKNVVENKLKNVVLIKAAVGDGNGMVELYKSFLNNGDHRLWGNSDTRETEVVCLRKLDDMLVNEEKIDLIKIDTQGWEPAVIGGAKNIIERDRPTIFLEYSPKEYDKAGHKGKKMLPYLRKVYPAIWEIDYWYYIYRKLGKNIRNDNRGYADLWMKKTVSWFDVIDGYRNIQIKKLIKRILGVK